MTKPQFQRLAVEAIAKSREERGNSIGQIFRGLRLFEALVYAILNLSQAIDNIPGDTITLLEDQEHD